MDHFSNQPSTSSHQIETVEEDEKAETMYEYVDENGQTVLIGATGSSIYVDEEGNTIIYTNLDGQEVVQEEIVEIEDTPRKTNKNAIGYPKSTVLLTNKCLEAEKAALNAKAGISKKKTVKETGRNVITNEEISILNKNLPGMKNMFKVVSESAMSKVTLKKVGESEKIAENTLAIEENDDERDRLEPPKTPPCLERQSGFTMEPLEYYKKWPIYSKMVIDFKMACEILIGSTEVASVRICKSHPLDFKGTGTFVVDLENDKECQTSKTGSNLNDNNGRWSIAQGKVRFYKEDLNKKLVRADDGKGQLKEWAENTFTYKILLRKYDHEDTRRPNEKGQGMFQRKLYSVTLGDGQQLNRVVITYSWIGGKAWNYLEKAKKDWKLEKVGELPQVVSAFFEGFTLFSHDVVEFNQAAAILLGGTVVDQTKVCGSVPIGFRLTGTFIIDMKRLKFGHLELRKDDNGLWGKPSGQNRFYKFAENGDAVRVDKSGKLMTGIDYDVKLTCKRYEHTQVDKKFVRKIYVAKGKNDSPVFEGSPDLGIIVYYWKTDPISFEPIYKQNDVNETQKNIEEYEDDEFVVTESSAETIPPSRKRARVQIEEVEEVANNVVEETEYRNMKIELIRREIDNQERFSTILNRADSLISRIDQRFLSEEHVIVEESAIYQHDHHPTQPHFDNNSFLEHSDA